MRAVPLYLPVHAVGMLLAAHKSVPLLLSNVFRSSLFLSVYCSSAWFAACQYYKLPFAHATWFNTLFVEWIPGLAVLIEKPSRRKVRLLQSSLFVVANVVLNKGACVLLLVARTEQLLESGETNL